MLSHNLSNTVPN